MNPIVEKYNLRAKKINSLVCIGLDADFSKIPERFKNGANPQFEFNKWVIDQTAEFAAAVKFNIAFYEARGDQGLRELKMSVDYLKANYPEIFTICDCKRADIGNTNTGYVEELFDYFQFDAVTLHPYLGKGALKPFLDRADKGCIILCRTSNPGAGEFQDLFISPPPNLPPQGGGKEKEFPPLEGEPARLKRSGGGKGGVKPLWQIVAEKVRDDWNENQNCMLVAGATFPDELKTIREIVGDMTLLVPGLGAQGGEVEATVEAGLNSKKLGMIVNSSRGIIFASNPAAEARKLRDEINKYR